MKWKAVLAVVVILAIAGFFVFTEFGNQFTSQLGLGSLTAFFVKQRPANVFAFNLTTRREAFFGQQYKVVNISLDATGIYQYIHVGNIYLESKEGKRITIAVRNFVGNFEITSGGSITLKGTATFAEIGELAVSPEKSLNVEVEIIPSTFVLASLQQNSINFASIVGTLQRGTANNLDSIFLANGKLTINYFAGTLSQQEDGTTTLLGSASSIKGDNFSFG
jgi:hypothetical protein